MWDITNWCIAMMLGWIYNKDSKDTVKTDNSMKCFVAFIVSYHTIYCLQKRSTTIYQHIASQCIIEYNTHNMCKFFSAWHTNVFICKQYYTTQNKHDKEESRNKVSPDS